MEFGYHRTNHAGAILGVLGFVVLIEGVGLHVALEARHPVVAWALSVVNALSLGWLVLDWRAVVRRPILVEEERLVVRRGLRGLVVARANVERAERGEVPFQPPADTGVLAFGRPNVVVTLRAPVKLGRRRVIRLGVYVDEPDAFVAALQCAEKRIASAISASAAPSTFASA